MCLKIHNRPFLVVYSSKPHILDMAELKPTVVLFTTSRACQGHIKGCLRCVRLDSRDVPRRFETTPIVSLTIASGARSCYVQKKCGRAFDLRSYDKNHWQPFVRSTAGSPPLLLSTGNPKCSRTASLCLPLLLSECGSDIRTTAPWILVRTQSDVFFVFVI